MGFFEIFIIAVSLSADAFAVSVCKGLAQKRVYFDQAVVIALFFGLFQALMPLLGYFLGTQFARFVEPVDHWIVFLLLDIIGGKMIWDGIHEDDEDSENAAPSEAKRTTVKKIPLDIKELFVLAIATSIDAFAVGCSFAFANVAIVPAVITIGITTFILSFIGATLGSRFGARYNKAATIAGGIILVLIGLKTLLEHLGLLPF